MVYLYWRVAELGGSFYFGVPYRQRWEPGHYPESEVSELARGKPTPGEKREQVKALKYLNPDLSLRDIARETGLSHTTVNDILKDLHNDDTFLQYRTEKKKEQIVKALDIASTYIDHLKNPEVIAKASARDSAIVAGTMIDKAQLLAGEPTAITERKEPTPDLVKELDQKVRKLKELTGS